MEVAFEDYVTFAAHDSYVGTLSGLEGKLLLEEAADVAFRMKTNAQNR